MVATNSTKLSIRTVGALAPREKPYIVFDTDIRGFGVRVMPAGVKSFILEYRPGAGGRSVAKKRLTLGRVGSMAVAQARSLALTALANIRLGSDPAAERASRRACLSLAALVDAYFAGHQIKPKTRANYEGALAKLLAAHGGAKADALTRAQVAAVHRAMADAPYFANRMLSALSSVFTWATDQGLIPEGHPKPTLKIETYAEHARERYLTPEEFARLGAALRAVEPQNPAPVAVVRVLILTGARLREILHMKWAYVDLDRGIVFLPDSKTGKKPIFLPAAAVAILERQPHLVGNPYVFPGRRPGAPLYSLTNQWATIQENAGLKGVRLHDLRHSFASIGAGQSLGLPVLGRLLGHTEPATTARYAHLADHPLRLAVEAIGGEIDAAMAPQIAPAK